METTVASSSHPLAATGQAAPVSADPESTIQNPKADIAHFAAPEVPWKRWMYLVLAVLLVGAFFYLNWCFFVLAHGGVDQNGYLVGGRMFHEHFSARLNGTNPDTGKVDPFLFVGRMWVGADVGTDAERFYPKYPIGLPMLIGLMFQIGGEKGGPWLTYWISPVCMTLAMAGTFGLIRAIAGSFAALLGTIALAVSPVTLLLSTNPNSHASTLFCVTWGMYFLVRWWQSGGAWRASLAGLLVGYATTIRYTEALLVLPLLLVVIFRLSSQWREARRLARKGIGEGIGSRGLGPGSRVQGPGEDQKSEVQDPHSEISNQQSPIPNPQSKIPRPLLESLLLLAWWSIPIIMLACFNLRAMGTLTGYDPTNESKGFSWDYFVVNWYAVLHQLNDTGMTFLFPLALAAMVWMFWWSWRMALVMASWVIPSALVYAFYYWAPDNKADPFGNAAAIGYLRFFLTILPALAACAYWLISQIYARAIDPDRMAGPQAVSMVMAGVLTAATIGVSLRSSMRNMELEHHQRLVLADRAQRIADAIESAQAQAGPSARREAVVFGREDALMHHLQFLTPHRYYNAASFNARSIESLMAMDPDAPQGLDPNRRMALAKRLDDMLSQRLGRSVEETELAVRRSEMQRMLVEEQDKVVSSAHKAGRRVFCITSGKTAEAARSILDVRGYDMRTVSSWNVGIPPPTYEVVRPFSKPRPTPSRRYDVGTWYQVVEVLPRAPSTASVPRGRN